MRTKEDLAQTLAEKHFAIEESVTHIYRLRDRAEVELIPAEPIKLLEVNTDTVP